MSSRSAEASIKGYNYQFLHTIKDILECQNNSDVVTIEGIEDLDIYNGNDKHLIQYKYHEEQSYTNSKVAKPIALMFEYFLSNKDKNIKYKLFIYLNNALPTLDKGRILEILKIKNARKILSSTDEELSDEDIDSYDDDIDDFLKVFEWKLTQRYEKLETSIISKFQSTTVGVSSDEAKILYLSNAIKIIYDLAIKSNEDDRKITKSSFISQLSVKKNIIFTGFILREKGFNKLRSVIKQQKRDLNIKKSSSIHVVHICKIDRVDTIDIIISLVKKFCYKDQKSDFKPIIFIVTDENNRYIQFKKELIEKIKDQNILLNDGYEDYAFNTYYFNKKPLINKNRAGNKIKDTSFNVKIIRESIYGEHKEYIDFGNNPSLFVIDSNDSVLSEKIKNSFFLNHLDTNQIIQLIGE